MRRSVILLFCIMYYIGCFSLYGTDDRYYLNPSQYYTDLELKGPVSSIYWYFSEPGIDSFYFDSEKVMLDYLELTFDEDHKILEKKSRPAFKRSTENAVQTYIYRNNNLYSILSGRNHYTCIDFIHDRESNSIKRTFNSFDKQFANINSSHISAYEDFDIVWEEHYRSPHPDPSFLSYRDVYVYDEKGSIVRELRYQNRSGSEFNLFEKRSSYNNLGNLTEEVWIDSKVDDLTIDDIPDYAGGQKKIVVSYVYDSNENLIAEKTEKLNRNQNEWLTTNESIYTYDSYNNMTSRKMFYHMQNYHMEYLYEYNKNHLLKKMTVYRYSGRSTLIGSYTYEYSYDNDNRMVGEIYISPGEEKKEIVFTYDDHGNWINKNYEVTNLINNEITLYDEVRRITYGFEAGTDRGISTEEAPALVFPAKDAVFNFYPGKIQLFWEPDSNSLYYEIDIQYTDIVSESDPLGKSVYQWKHVDGNLTRSIDNQLDIVFDMARPGRWRVRGIGTSRFTEWSNWNYFRFTN